ncbi:MAG: GAF domain-containing protein [Sporocytophaga sp.]|nr:GAF domain-containing protein [Sporocytophaga sp.]
MKMILSKVHALANLLFIGLVVYSIILFSKFSGIDNNILSIFYITLSAGIISIILNYVVLNTKSFKEIVYVDRLKNEFIVDKEEEIVRQDQSNIVSEVKKEIDAITNSKIDGKDKMDKALSVICNKINAGQSVLFFKDQEENKLKRYSSYALPLDSSNDIEFAMGEGLVGLVAKEGKTLVIDDLKESYMIPFSGLGTTKSVDVMILPLLKSEEIIGVWEISLLKKASENDKNLIQNLTTLLGDFLALETQYN